MTIYIYLDGVAQSFDEIVSDWGQGQKHIDKGKLRFLKNDIYLDVLRWLNEWIIIYSIDLALGGYHIWIRLLRANWDIFW